jgi:hypothetical protein
VKYDIVEVGQRPDSQAGMRRECASIMTSRAVGDMDIYASASASGITGTSTGTVPLPVRHTYSTSTTAVMSSNLLA